MSLLEVARRQVLLDELERDGTAAQLRAVAAILTVDEHHRLATEAAAGDPLAALVQAAVAMPAGTKPA